MSLSKRPSSGLFSKAKDTVVSAIQFARFDAWQNVLTGLGGVADKRMWSRFRMSRILTDQELSDLFHFEWLAKLVVRILPETAMAKGFELVVSEDEGAKKSKPKGSPDEDEDEGPQTREDADDAEDLETAVLNRCAELEAWGALQQAAIWGRTYGAGVVYMGVDDGGSSEQPLNWDRVKGLNFLSVVDKRDLTITGWFTDPTQPRFGRPKIVTLYRTQTGGIPDPRVGRGVPVHVDRLLMFGGELTGDREKAANQGWDYSVLQVVYDILRDQGMTWASAAALLQQSSQAVYKVKDLTRILGSEQGEEELQKRFRMIEMSRSIARALIIDADGEEFEHKSPTFTGIPDLLQQFCNQLAAATRIPVTILMGQAPAGLNATGASDLRTWEGECVKWQMDVLKPQLERLVRILLLEQGAEPETWQITFPAIATETPMERAALRKTVAETDAIYITAGVTLPEEVAKSRFPAEGWSAETQIDLELRDELEDEKRDQLIEQAGAGGNNQEQGTVGARAEALAAITEQVASGAIDQATGVARIVALFAMTPDQAGGVLGEVKVQPQAVQPGQVPGQPMNDPDMDEAAQLLGELPAATLGAKPKGASKPGAPRADAERTEFERAEDGTFGSGPGVRGPAQDKPAADAKPKLATKDEDEARSGLQSAIAKFRSDPSDANRAAVASARDELRGHLSAGAEARRASEAKGASVSKDPGAKPAKAKNEKKAAKKPEPEKKPEPKPEKAAAKPTNPLTRAGYTLSDPSDPRAGYKPLTPEQMSGPTSPGVERMSAADLAKYEPQQITDSLPRIVSDNGTLYDDKVWISDYRAATGASDKDIDRDVRAGKLSLKAFDFAHNSPGQSERREASLLKRDRSEYLALAAKPAASK